MQKKGAEPYHTAEVRLSTIALLSDSQSGPAVRGRDQEQPQCTQDYGCRDSGLATGAAFRLRFAGQDRGSIGQPRGIGGQQVGKPRGIGGVVLEPRLAPVIAGGQPRIRRAVCRADRPGVMAGCPVHEVAELPTAAEPAPRPGDEGFSRWGGGVRSRCCGWWRARCRPGCRVVRGSGRSFTSLAKVEADLPPVPRWSNR